MQLFLRVRLNNFATSPPARLVYLEDQGFENAIRLLPLPLDLRDFSNQKANFVTIEFCNRRDTVNVPD